MVTLLHVRPYLFDREFQDLLDEPADVGAGTRIEEVVEADDTPPAPPPPPTFSEDELTAAREIAYADGERTGRNAAEQAIAARSTRVLELLTDELQRASAAIARDQSAIIRDATAIALTICRKILPHTYRATAGEEIAELLSAVLPRISEQPQVLVRVAAPLAPMLAEPTANVVAASGFSGTLKVLADDALPEGDCRIEWSQGGVVRDAATLLREIELVLNQTAGSHPAAAAFDRLPLTDPSSEGAPDAEPAPESWQHSASEAHEPTELPTNPSQRADTDE